MIREEVDAALADRSQGSERRIPISGITGTLSKPRLQLDAQAVASLAAAYAGSDRLLEKLQKKIGRPGAEAVGSLLERLLGGRKAEP